MDLNGKLNDEEQLVKNSFDEYCEKNYVPYYEQYLEKRIFPGKIMKDLSEMLLPSTISLNKKEKVDDVMLGILSEEMGKYEFPLPVFLSIHFSKLLPYINNENVREEYIKRYLAGDSIICGAYTEPGHGSDAYHITTEAHRSGNNYILSGEKAFVSNPGLSDVFMVSAKTDKGISIMMVDRAMKGIEPYEIENMAYMFKGEFGGVRMNNVKVPDTYLVGEENRGFKLLMDILSIQRVHVGLYAIGIAESALDEAIEYAKMRKAFGEPISKFEAVSFRLAEDKAKIESIRAIAYKALAMENCGMDNSIESAAVKGYGCEVAFNAVSDALQTLGAAGYSKTSSIERKFRISRGFLLGDGTPDIQKLIISRKLFGKEFSP
ncbi:acyl-CoA dehydrogenase family protein [Ferroplasma sp.]|uniref:acyl-CoA dehydrogenase family protein n=1 Tax=Ferroplasma sp. TaxID=2591003 RepID=UPI00261F4C1B|nr:acyl-CoA dehydrogenase family protein [Ferroplasma sp.]